MYVNLLSSMVCIKQYFHSSLISFNVRDLIISMVCINRLSRDYNFRVILQQAAPWADEEVQKRGIKDSRHWRRTHISPLTNFEDRVVRATIMSF